MKEFGVPKGFVERIEEFKANSLTSLRLASNLHKKSISGKSLENFERNIEVIYQAIREERIIFG